MIYLLNILIAAVFSFLTLSVFPHLRIFGVVPMLTLFFLISLAYFRKGFEPFIVAAFAGIFFDLYSGFPFGSYLILFLFVTSMIRFMFSEGMHNLSFWRYLFLSELALLLFYGYQMFYLLLFKHISFQVIYLRPILTGILVNLVYVILVYVFSLWYFDRLLTIEDKLKRR